MNKTADRLPSIRALVALAGVAALAACQCSDTQVNETRDVVTRVLERLDNLDAICAADARVTEADGRVRITPQVRNPRAPVSGALRLIMTVDQGGRVGRVPAGTDESRYLQLREDRGYDGLTPIEEATLELPRGNAPFSITTTVWQPLYPRPTTGENNVGDCHIRYTEYPPQG